MGKLGNIKLGRVWVADTEVYENYFLFAAKNHVTGKVVSFEMAKGEKLERERFRRFLERHLIVTFNGNDFDLPIIYAALAGFPPKRLKEIANAIIVDKMKPWDVERHFRFFPNARIDHIDLIEVAPGAVGLKLYNGRLHGRRMQDLPIDEDAWLSPKDMDDIYDYCVNDLDATKLLFDTLLPRIELRIQMSREYGIDLRSKSDAQIAEAVIGDGIAKMMGAKPRRPKIHPGTWYRYKIPEFIAFRGGELNDVLDDIEDSKFRLSEHGKVILPKALAEANIPIGDGVYRMGIGGLHSTESSTSHVADDEYFLIERDVQSYYPRIIINLGLYPKHMGRAFLKVYRGIVSRRLAAKAAGDQIVDETLKIVINGSFGKFGSKYSILYSPDLLIQTTITGQLSLLMLIERLELAGHQVVSANTDGIVIKGRHKHRAEVDAIVARWERDTGFSTDEAQYSALYSRDVNNYIAVKADGGVKVKGAFAKTGAMKNPTGEIIVEAVISHITEGKSLYRTIRDCRDVTKFVTVRTVKGGAVWGVKEYEIERISEKTGRVLKPGIGFDTSQAEYLGKAIRFYYSDEVEGAIHYKTNGNRVPKSDGARPLMELTDDLPDDIDITRYVKESRSVLRDIGFERALV